MAINVVGLISIIVFYLLILLIGLWAGRKVKQTGKDAKSENVMLAGRNIGAFVGVFTMTGEWGKKCCNANNTCRLIYYTS